MGNVFCECAQSKNDASHFHSDFERDDLIGGLSIDTRFERSYSEGDSELSESNDSLQNVPLTTSFEAESPLAKVKAPLVPTPSTERFLLQFRKNSDVLEVQPSDGFIIADAENSINMVINSDNPIQIYQENELI